ncbi:hypothetical protein BDY17DRAFT_352810 [Neohortaea acidophila]|uniref:Uncharacterized protein n=1 Tax=Neohortaea acidophila TaxID=245834 RepID=A0A6A6PX06_9PEZI|nr:uncharacterized protein BDY17DRAFT_352810 [Neohortaea acidophila]KAF2484286.1 hypothetical protein BDY17DRAFT_352810 [Neohortaea acidophila]
MSADNDGDSQMLSSPSDSETQTPTSQSQSLANSTLLSPPELHNRLAAAPGANANGKRPINTISNGTDDADDLLASGPSAAAAGGKARPEYAARTHERSGYTWSREEDAPGHAWLSKKALDEYHRAADVLVHRDLMVKGRYGDPFEMAEREQALANSLKQK